MLLNIFVTPMHACMMHPIIFVLLFLQFQISHVIEQSGHPKETSFTFMKCMNKTLTKPVTSSDSEWSGKRLHSLAGQGAIYLVLEDVSYAINFLI